MAGNELQHANFSCSRYTMQTKDFTTGEPIKLEPRDEEPRFPYRPQQATGLRKRGQNASTCSSSSGSQGDHTSWRNTHARSVASAQSEQSLGIYDYYLDSRKETEQVDNVKRFNFGKRSKASSAPVTMTLPSRDSVEQDTEGAQRSSREHIFRMLKTPATPAKARRTAQLWSKQDRRRSSLSICCQGLAYEEPILSPSTCWPVQESESDRQCSIQSSVGRSRKDSGASFAQTSPTDSRHTAASWLSKGTYRYSGDLDHRKVSQTWSAGQSTVVRPESRLVSSQQEDEKQQKPRRSWRSRLRSMILCS